MFGPKCLSNVNHRLLANVWNCSKHMTHFSEVYIIYIWHIFLLSLHIYLSHFSVKSTLTNFSVKSTYIFSEWPLSSIAEFSWDVVNASNLHNNCIKSLSRASLKQALSLNLIVNFAAIALLSTIEWNDPGGIKARYYWLIMDDVSLGPISWPHVKKGQLQYRFMSP